MTRILILTLLAGATLVAKGQSRWTASAVTGVAHMSSSGTLNLQTYDANVHGRGIRLRSLFIGETFAYVPVTAQHGMTFRVLGLRAEDSSVDGSVRAEFIRQPRDANGGPAVVLATVETVNVAPDGFQFRTIAFPVHTIDLNLHSYYIRIRLQRRASMATPTAYDVSLTQ